MTRPSVCMRGSTPATASRRETTSSADASACRWPGGRPQRLGAQRDQLSFPCGRADRDLGAGPHFGPEPGGDEVVLQLEDDRSARSEPDAGPLRHAQHGRDPRPTGHQTGSRDTAAPAARPAGSWRLGVATCRSPHRLLPSRAWSAACWTDTAPLPTTRSAVTRTSSARSRGMTKHRVVSEPRPGSNSRSPTAIQRDPGGGSSTGSSGGEARGAGPRGAPLAVQSERVLTSSPTARARRTRCRTNPYCRDPTAASVPAARPGRWRPRTTSRPRRMRGGAAPPPRGPVHRDTGHSAGSGSGRRARRTCAVHPPGVRTRRGGAALPALRETSPGARHKSSLRSASAYPRQER